jgi:dolichol-phosphate mannosyltransferase
MKIIVIIPTYNEQENISRIISQIQAVFKKINHHQMQILVFDSHSSDHTVENVKQCQQTWGNIHLLTEPKKTGLGSAYTQAMRYATNTLEADAVVEFDADGSHQPKYLIDMVKKLDQGYEVVVGSRYIKGGKVSVDWPWYRRLISKAGNWVSRTVLTRKYKDFTSGFRLTRTQVLRRIDLTQLLSKQYAYKLHLLWWLHKINAKIIEIPIEFIDRTQGVSKLPRHTIIDSLAVVSRLRLRELITYIKVCACGLIGMILQIITFNILVTSISPTLSNTIATELAILSNFITNNYFTYAKNRFSFRKKTRHFLKKILHFNLCSMLSLILQIAIMHVGVRIWGYGLLIYNALLIAGILLGSVTNYFFYQKIIWKHRKKETVPNSPTHHTPTQNNAPL